MVRAVGVTPAGLSQSSIGSDKKAGPVGACMAMACVRTSAAGASCARTVSRADLT